MEAKGHSFEKAHQALTVSDWNLDRAKEFIDQQHEVQTNPLLSVLGGVLGQRLGMNYGLGSGFSL